MFVPTHKKNDVKLKGLFETVNGAVKLFTPTFGYTCPIKKGGRLREKTGDVSNPLRIFYLLILYTVLLFDS